MSVLRRFANWVRTDYPGPKGPHIAWLALCGDRVLEVRRDTNGSVWAGWRGVGEGQWFRLG